MVKYRKVFWLCVVVLLIIFLFTSCASSTNIEYCVDTTPYGFWSGLWHGMISFFSFFISLFDEDVTIYAVNNTGSWYDFGFVIGSGILSFCGSSVSRNN